MDIKTVDICCGLAWGDEAKGKLVSELLKTKDYNFVCRWSGGSNAGHTIYVNDTPYYTHIIPAGVFYNIPSFIGPDCYINMQDFENELNYLKENGFNTDLIKISPKAHIILDEHVLEDKLKNMKNQTSTGKGISPCARDKYCRVGTLVKDGIWEKYKHHIFEGELFGNILCEGAQGFWLDINHGNYPYVTSSYTLPYSACSLGFPPQKINDIYGAVKIYDTRVGADPEFENINIDEEILENIGNVGKEFGVTTGRKRKVMWLNVDKLIKAINISGCTKIIISKVDILEKVGIFKFIFNTKIVEYDNLINLKSELCVILMNNCLLLKKIIFSDSPKNIDNL